MMRQVWLSMKPQNPNAVSTQARFGDEEGDDVIRRRFEARLSMNRQFVDDFSMSTQRSDEEI